MVFHRRSEFGFLRPALRSGARLCEYGAGVAPVSMWIAERYRRTPLELVIVDVPSEHFAFGAWRLRRRIEELGAPIRVESREVHPGRLPLAGDFDAITILDVFEHLTNPHEVARHLCWHLRPGGLLCENFVAHDDPHAADLAVAQRERPAVFAALHERLALLRGPDPRSDGGATRTWRRRP